MRITSQQHEAIVKTVREFIPDGKVILFGSRADDARRGGDIDLFVETSAKPALESRLLFSLFGKTGKFDIFNGKNGLPFSAIVG